jgi:hypothetical protein
VTSSGEGTIEQEDAIEEAAKMICERFVGIISLDQDGVEGGDRSTGAGSSAFQQ